MNKKKLWILMGSIVIALLLILLLIILSIPKKEEPFVAKTHSTANGGTIYALNKASESVAFNTDGTSVSDALYEYKSKLGYSLQYNNKYYVDFGTKEYDFKISSKDNLVNATIAIIENNEEFKKSVSDIQTKEDWDNLMGTMLGESANFNKTTINNMVSFIARYTLSLNDGQQMDMIYAMLIGNKNIYNYMYSATPSASEIDATNIGNVLFTIKEFQ